MGLTSGLFVTLLKDVLKPKEKNICIVECEHFHADNESRPSATPPIVTPRRLPDRLSPPPIERLVKKEDAKKSTAWTRATPRPSLWPLDCVLHQINANAPIEDRGVITLLDVNKHFFDEPGPSSKWLMACVIDGHSGWQTAEFISRTLAARIQKSLNEAEGSTLTAESVSKLLCRCFERLDDELKNKIEPAFNIGHSSVAKPGATTCATFITPARIIAANVGDSRAYLCRGGRAIPLTNQHNAGDEKEAVKLRDAHPNEDDLIKVHVPAEKEADKKEPAAGYLDSLSSLAKWVGRYPPKNPPRACYTKGRLQLTRAFGDFYLKEAKFAVDWDQGRLLVNTPHSFPYLSKLPEVSVMSRDLENDEFLVVASDGVWDELSPQEVCNIVRSEMRAGNTLSTAAKRLQETVLQRASENAKMSVEELQQLAPRQRRDHYDDMTIAIVSLRHQYDSKGNLVKRK